MGKYGTVVKSPFAAAGKVRASRLYAEAEFRTIVNRECARAERNSHVFTVVAFRIGGHQDNSVLAEQRLSALRRRLRATDDIGWFDAHHVGVLLYDTPVIQAQAYLRTIRRMAEFAEISMPIIYVYPTSRLDTGSTRLLTTGRDFDLVAEACGRTEPRGSRASVAPLEPQLSRPMPASKRAMDILGSLAGLTLIAPVFLGIAFAIKLTSSGPVFFGQLRAGLGGKPFTMYKFRSMVAGAEGAKNKLLNRNERSGPVFKIADDPRVTAVGRFIRRWSLDELPQLFNVLRGDMSLVGPRPLPIDETLQSDVWHRRRLDITPGITCLWQVQARDQKCFDVWVRLDLEYAQRQSFFTDLKILLLTVPAVISGRGAW